MKKSIKFSLVLVLILGAFLVNLSAQVSKIGYVDSERIMREYPAVQKAQEKFNEEAAIWETQVNNLKKEIEKMQDDYEKQKLLISEAKRKEKEKAIMDKQADYEKLVSEIYGQGGKASMKNAELLKPIIEKINKVIQKIAKDENYDYIFDVVNGNIIFAKENYDLSTKVLEELKKIDAAEEKEKK